MDIAAGLGLAKVVFELVAHRENEAVLAAERVGFKEVAILEGRVKGFWGNYQDLVLEEIPISDRERCMKTKATRTRANTDQKARRLTSCGNAHVIVPRVGWCSRREVNHTS